MKNYAIGKPVGNNAVPFYDSPPPEVSKGTAARENAAVSSILILDDNATAVAVAATNAGAVIKWLTQATVDSSVAGTSVISAAGSANFDGYVNSDTVKYFIIPVAGSASHEGEQVGANVANNLYTHVALKSTGASSVATMQF